MYRGTCWQQRTHSGNTLSRDQIFNSCAVCEPSPLLVLADGYLSDRQLKTRGLLTRRCKAVGLGLDAFTNCGRWQDVRISNRDFASCSVVPAGRRGQQPASPWRPTLCSQEASGSLFYRQDILKKQLRKDHSSTLGNAAPRGVSLLLSLTQIRRRAWQHFHFCHELISYDWALMGFCG